MWQGFRLPVPLAGKVCETHEPLGGLLQTKQRPPTWREPGDFCEAWINQSYLAQQGYFELLDGRHYLGIDHEKELNWTQGERNTKMNPKIKRLELQLFWGKFFCSRTDTSLSLRRACDGVWISKELPLCWLWLADELDSMGVVVGIFWFDLLIHIRSHQPRRILSYGTMSDLRIGYTTYVRTVQVSQQQHHLLFSSFCFLRNVWLHLEGNGEDSCLAHRSSW